ncbi:hypothetical protein D3C85_1774390 [compost metagenome]
MEYGKGHVVRDAFGGAVGQKGAQGRGNGCGQEHIVQPFIDQHFFQLPLGHPDALQQGELIPSCNDSRNNSIDVIKDSD